MRLRIFSDRQYLPSDARHRKHVEMLIPFWGPWAQGTPSATLQPYVAQASALFELVETPAAADLTILPADWKRYVRSGETTKAQDFARRMHSLGKPLAVFFHDDSAAPLPLPGRPLIFRTSLYRSVRRPGEFALPAGIEDLAASLLGGLHPRPKPTLPVVGFCGYATLRPLSIRDQIYTGLQWARHRGQPPTAGQYALTLRVRLLAALRAEAQVIPNFIVRDQFYGGSVARAGVDTARFAAQVRSEYLQNMTDSDCVVCVRGNGNFSFRLDETLYCGRVPVFLDTDCVLPYDFAVNYSQLFIWLTARDISQAGQRIAASYVALSEAAVQTRQQQCRAVWEQWLSPLGFFTNLHRHLIT